MAFTINPAVSRSGGEWRLASVAFMISTWLGAIGGVAAITILVGLIREISLQAAYLTSIAALVLAVLREFGVPLPIPYRGKQVPEYWRSQGNPWMVAIPFGLLLGFGFATPFLGSAHLAAMLAAAWLTSVPSTLLIAGMFALGRSSVLLASVGASDLMEIEMRLTREVATPWRGFSRRLVSLAATASVIVSLGRETWAA